MSEPTVYRLLKAHDLITSPAFNVIKASDEFHDKTVRPNQLWQTDFTYLKIIGWGWYYLSTILDDYPTKIAQMTGSSLKSDVQTCRSIQQLGRTPAVRRVWYQGPSSGLFRH